MQAGPGDSLAGGALQGVPSQGQVCLRADPVEGGLGQRVCGEAKGLSHSSQYSCRNAVPLLGNQHSLKAFVWAKSDSTVFAWIGFLQVQSIIEHANKNYNSVSPVLLPFGNV